MIIYIKEDEIITEFEYTVEDKQFFLESGFQAVYVPYTETPWEYTLDDFEKTEDGYKYIGGE